jgi:hypothetical protein
VLAVVVEGLMVNEPVLLVDELAVVVLTSVPPVVEFTVFVYQATVRAVPLRGPVPTLQVLYENLTLEAVAFRQNETPPVIERAELGEYSLADAAMLKTLSSALQIYKTYNFFIKFVLSGKSVNYGIVLILFVFFLLSLTY